MNPAQHILVCAIRLYQWTVSPLLATLAGPMGRCRFTPSCSQYALDAVRTRGALKGSALAVWRICRCNPWGGCGHDPVPNKGGPIFKHKFQEELTAESRGDRPHPSPLPQERETHSGRCDVSQARHLGECPSKQNGLQPTRAGIDSNGHCQAF